MLTKAEVLVRITGLSAQLLDEWIVQTWVRPIQAKTEHVFDNVDLARLHLILDLTKAMGVNDEAVPIILSLVDQVQTLRAGLSALNMAVATHDDETVSVIATRLRDLLSRTDG